MRDLSDTGGRSGLRRRIARDRRRRKRRLVLLMFFAALVTAGAGAAWAADTDVLARGPDDVQVTMRPQPRHPRVRPHGTLPGALLIADRGNDRIVLVNEAHRVLWRFPTRWDLQHGVHLNFNDDSFVAAGGQSIVANEEEAHTVVQIDIKTHNRIHLYGVPGVAGSGPGLLNTPDDAYPLPNGQVEVADAYNCRVIWVSHHRILLSELAQSDRRVRELTGAVGEPQSLVSYHLRRLRAAEMVFTRRSAHDRRDAYYGLNLERCGELLADAGTALHPGLRFAASTSVSERQRQRSRPPRVLFLCTGNSSRSQIAEALLQQLSGGGGGVQRRQQPEVAPTECRAGDARTWPRHLRAPAPSIFRGSAGGASTA